MIELIGKAPLINEYITKWQLSQPVKLAETPTANIYRVSQGDSLLALKILTLLGQRTESHSSTTLKCFNGIGSVNLIDFDSAALLIEYIDGPKLSTLVKDGEDLKAADVICEVLDQLHDYKEPVPKQIPDLETRFRSLFLRARTESKDSIFYRAAKVAEKLIASETERRLLHGDIHHTNILKSSKRGWLSIDPLSVYGERTYDFANTFFNPDDTPDIVENRNRIDFLAETYAQHLDIDKRRVLDFAFAHGGLSMSWQLDDGENPKRRLKITSLIESL